MSSLIAEFRQTEEAIKELHARLEQLKSDERLIRELEFADELKQLMIRYDRNELAVLNVLFPDQNYPAPRKRHDEPKQRRVRRVKIYRNPHTNEVIETKGGNHRTLKEWKATWGAEEVESWAQVKG